MAEHDPYVQGALVHLVHTLAEFRTFWEKMALELEADKIQGLSPIDEPKLPREAWNLQVHHYRRCSQEVMASVVALFVTQSIVRSTTHGCRS